MAASSDMPSTQVFLPDFCGSRRVVAVLVICELVALLLALADLADDGLFWQRLFLLSVYLQWIGVCSAAALCLIRQYVGHWDSRAVAALCYVALLTVTLAVTEITYTAGRYTGIAPLVEAISHADFLLRNLGICAIVAALGLRYFWLRARWQGQARAEAEARYQALQARIRPHFLFNTLNSIATLIGLRPDDAEAAIEDLGALLRANLGDAERAQIPLSEELDVCRAYTRIESLRLGERLQLQWRIEDRAGSWPVPPLCLQPLIENAIAHGIARLPDGGTVTISAAVEGGALRLRVDNPLPPDAVDAPGLHLALDNIRQRLALRYGGQASLTTRSDGARFSVYLRLPRQGDWT